ncbi:hypothetical protein OHB26_26975 [Nocardia sp. NBC_01503]|uniref:hypothetical protein n=1 Tax=Nocardia sp. NBC_01503 TaxID=2975997 RepID=UPI002E7BA889|nr:hypothetical protein [Nocardia sp. NBC_01503]WTL30556.1 hypothetical protein OHB26_26975 [Nocardia sp. NBC_01503]
MTRIGRTWRATFVVAMALTTVSVWSGSAQARQETACLTGTLTYTRPDAEAGTGLPMVTSPARNANWALYSTAHPGFLDRPLAADLTDRDGNFKACADGVAGSDLYLTFIAESSALWQVLPQRGDAEQPYTFTVPATSITGTRDLGAIAVPDDMAGAWKVLDTLNLLWWKRPATAGNCWTPQPHCTSISVIWPSAGGQNGNSYFTTAGFVYLTEDDANTRHVTLHEAGHNLQWLWQHEQWADVTNCSPHYINLASSPSCAFTEGFADAVAMHALDDYRFVWNSGFSANLENDADTRNWDIGDSVEGRVATSLVDLWNGPDHGWDATLGILGKTVPADFHDYFYNARPTENLSTTGQAATIIHNHTADRSSPNGAASPQPIDEAARNKPLGPPDNDPGVKLEPRHQWKSARQHWTLRPPYPRSAP